MDTVLDKLFASPSLRKLRIHFYPALWALSVILFCKTLLFVPASNHGISTSTSHNQPIIVSPQTTDHQDVPSIDFTDSSPTLDISIDPTEYLNISTSAKVAAIIETRTSGNIIPLILHFASVLGPSWPIILYTDSASLTSFQSSHSFNSLISSGRMTLRSLPSGAYFPNWDSVSGFLTSKWLWENLAPAENVLLFQADSILCANAARSVDEFFEWDFIGAPIAERWGKGYNGGLSLRKRQTVLRVLEEWTYGKKSRPHPEDQWFFAR